MGPRLVLRAAIRRLDLSGNRADFKEVDGREIEIEVVEVGPRDESPDQGHPALRARWQTFSSTPTSNASAARILTSEAEWTSCRDNYDVGHRSRIDFCSAKATMTAVIRPYKVINVKERTSLRPVIVEPMSGGTQPGHIKIRNFSEKEDDRTKSVARADADKLLAHQPGVLLTSLALFCGALLLRITPWPETPKL